MEYKYDGHSELGLLLGSDSQNSCDEDTDLQPIPPTDEIGLYSRTLRSNGELGRDIGAASYFCCGRRAAARDPGRTGFEANAIRGQPRYRGSGGAP